MTSTIALIERLKQLSSPEAEILSDGYRLDEFVKAGVDAATELTTLLQRCEKAEAERDTVRKANEKLARQIVDDIGRAELAERQRNEARKALEPFVRDLDNWTDDNGWTEEAPKNDRICDWFGPSDFRAARNAMGEPVDKQNSGDNPE